MTCSWRTWIVTTCDDAQEWWYATSRQDSSSECEAPEETSGADFSRQTSGKYQESALRVSSLASAFGPGRMFREPSNLFKFHKHLIATIEFKTCNHSFWIAGAETIGQRPRQQMKLLQLLIESQSNISYLSHSKQDWLPHRLISLRKAGNAPQVASSATTGANSFDSAWDLESV